MRFKDSEIRMMDQVIRKGRSTGLDSLCRSAYGFIDLFVSGDNPSLTLVYGYV